MGINAHFIYSSVYSNVGGYYDRDNNTIMISNRAFLSNNIYNVVSTIEHEGFHKEFGKVKIIF